MHLRLDLVLCLPADNGGPQDALEKGEWLLKRSDYQEYRNCFRPLSLRLRPISTFQLALQDNASTTALYHYTLVTTIMSKVLVVFGATGQQGGSVVNCVINDPELSKLYKVRGVTRDPSNSLANLYGKGAWIL